MSNPIAFVDLAASVGVASKDIARDYDKADYSTNRAASRAAFTRALYDRAPHCQYALRFVVAGLLASDLPSDTLLTVADALREAASELAFEGPVMHHQVRSIRALADALAEDAPRRAAA